MSIYLNQPLAVLSALVAHEDVEMSAIAEAAEDLRAAIVARPPADVMAVIRAAARGEALVDVARVTLARIEAGLALDDDDTPPLPNLDVLTVAERAARFPVGQRVRFLRTVERYPSFTVPAGATGTVVPAEGHGVYVLLDVKVPGTEEWRGEVHWYDDGANGDGFLEELGGDIEPITDTPKCHGQEDEFGVPSCEGKPVALYRASHETVLNTAHGDRPYDEVFYSLWCPGCAALAEGENHVTHVADIQPA